jgi:hypothetical protein
MKKILLIALLAVFATITASAQTYDYDVDELRDNWEKTISVPASDAPIVEKLFKAWSKEFPTTFAEIFNTYKKTGDTKNQSLYDYKVDYAPKNGFIEVYGSWSMIADEDCNFSKGDTITREDILQAVYWNLQNGNKLFGVSVKVDGEIFANCAVFFYEYNVAKNVLTPRTDITKKVLEIIGEDQETFVQLPKVGRDIKYQGYDYKAEKMTDMLIKWNGNGF